MSQNNTVKLADFGAAKDKLGQVTIGAFLQSVTASALPTTRQIRRHANPYLAMIVG